MLFKYLSFYLDALIWIVFMIEITLLSLCNLIYTSNAKVVLIGIKKNGFYCILLVELRC